MLLGVRQVLLHFVSKLLRAVLEKLDDSRLPFLLLISDEHLGGLVVLARGYSSSSSSLLFLSESGHQEGCRHDAESTSLSLGIVAWTRIRFQ